MTAPSFRLDGLVALVTGSGGGIGAAIAGGLAQAGADVACLDRSADLLARTVASVRDAGGRGLAISGDVTDAGSVQEAVRQAQSELGELRLAVNCAGIVTHAPAEEMTRSAWQDVIDVNLTGVFLSCQAEGAAMLANGGGAIVNIGSVSGSIANRGLTQVHYNSSKAGVAHLSRSLAVEWASRNVRVNTISPGYVRTGLARRSKPTRSYQDYLNDIPMGRMAQAQEIVGPTVFLLSEAASYCTGAELVVDGGLICW
jgi:NAD(P)-dependent dehydrogenase (short-subunit alcohol dehydrogenase family)